LRVIVACWNLISFPVLQKCSVQPPGMISVLIPARNEESVIGPLLESLSRQRFQQYEILVLDDDSTDRTALEVDHAAKTNPRISLLKSELLPEGWIGKTWACHQLANHARGDYFLFLDADVIVKNGLLEAGVGELISRKI